MHTNTYFLNFCCMKIQYIYFFTWSYARKKQDILFFVIFAMFLRKSGILIPDSYLYDIKIQTDISQMDRKTREKNTIFKKYFFEFFLNWTEPGPLILGKFGPVNSGALSTVHA